MTAKCSESVTKTSVDMSCSTTKCSLSKTDTAHHVTDIYNRRPGGIYQLEICSLTLNSGLVDFNGSPKSITQYGSLGTYSHAPTTTINLNPLGGLGTEEILTTVEFHDSTQRLGTNTYMPPKESYQVDYSMDLL
jgi:hypothetical protein